MKSRHRVVSIVHDVNASNHLDTVTTDEESSQEDKVDFNKILEKYISYAANFAFPAVIRSAHEFRNNYSSLLISLQTFLNNSLTNSNKHVPSVLLDVIIAVLNLIWDLSDKIPLVPMFIDIGYSKKTIQWIRTDIFTSYINDLGDPIFSIVHNLSRNKTGLKQLRAEKAFDILMERKQLINDEKHDELTSFGTALIALATNDEQSEDNKKLILDTSELLYKSCKETDQNTELRHNGVHLSELLELLYRAFSNTYVIQHILRNKTNEKPTPIQYFAQLLLSIYGAILDPEPDELEKRAVEYLLKILLQISSYPEYQIELTGNNQFCVIIETLANRPKQDDAKRIWCNIQQIMSPDEPKKENSSMIYISYDWADDEFCKEFLKELRDKITIPIWVDFENVELCDDMWEYSSPIIKSATMNIVLISTAYGESTDKFQELSYIISTNKSMDEKKGIIIVKAEPNFDFNRGWMRDLLHDKTVISYDNNIDKMASKVCEQIVVSKKPPITCLPCQGKYARRKTAKSGDFSANSGSRLLNSVAATDSSLVAAKAYVQNEPLNTTDDSNVLIATRGHDSHSVVSGLITQTGSADLSTWV